MLKLCCCLGWLQNYSQQSFKTRHRILNSRLWGLLLFLIFVNPPSRIYFFFTLFLTEMRFFHEKVNWRHQWSMAWAETCFLPSLGVSELPQKTHPAASHPLQRHSGPLKLPDLRVGQSFRGSLRLFLLHRRADRLCSHSRFVTRLRPQTIKWYYGEQRTDSNSAGELERMSRSLLLTADSLSSSRLEAFLRSEAVLIIHRGGMFMKKYIASIHSSCWNTPETVGQQHSVKTWCERIKLMKAALNALQQVFTCCPSQDYADSLFCSSPS